MRRSLITILAIAALAASGCGGKKADAPPPNAGKGSPKARPVRVVKATWGSVPHLVEITGHLEAINRANVYSKITGRVDDVLVREGAPVQRGQPLVVLDARDLDAAVQRASAAVEVARSRVRQAATGHDWQGRQVGIQERQAQAAVRQAQDGVDQAKLQLADAERERERSKMLFERGAYSRQQLDKSELAVEMARNALTSAQSRLDHAQQELKMTRANTMQVEIKASEMETARAALHQAQADLASAQVQRDYATIRSPITGVVAKRNVDPGEIVSGGTGGAPLLVLADNTALELEASVEEKVMSALRRGTGVKLAFSSFPGQEFPGRVSEVVPAADPSTHTVLVKVRLANPGGRLVAGMFGRATLESRVYAGVVVPRDAVIHREGKTLLALQDGDKARLVEVTVAYEDGRRAVVKGASAGASVIVEGNDGIADDTPIVVGSK